MDNQQQGKITMWNDKKGFGFIKPKQGGKNVFFHISQVANKGYRPAKNTSVTYTLSYDDQQRPRATNVEFTSTPTYPSLIPTAISSVFLIILIIVTLIFHKPLWIPISYVIISSITFFAYYIDKAEAMRREQRVPEIALHTLEFLGGWPGALIAQYYYRHKIKKFSYLAIYWVLVISNVGVLTWFYLPIAQTINVTGGLAPHAWCERDPAPANWLDSPITIVAVDKQRERVTLQNVSDTTVNLNDWVMCSFRGSQQHPLQGTIQPRETISFLYTNGNVWSNSDTDNGGLYNSAGELVSYWKDQ